LAASTIAIACMSQILIGSMLGNAADLPRP
jgi:hypothetical protein